MAIVLPRMNLRKGDDFQASVACKVGDVEQDMTGWSLEAELTFNNCTAVPLVVEWDVIESGLAKISLEDAETQKLSTGEHLLQLRAISPGDKKSSSRPITVVVRD